MSIAISWTNGRRAFVFSDGLLVSGDGSIAGRDRKKFFRTRGGVLVAACGFLGLCEAVERETANLDCGFSETVCRLSEFVQTANKEHSANSISRPLGALAVGRDAGWIKSANIFADGTDIHSGTCFQYLSAAEDAESAIHKVGLALQVASAEDAEKYCRELIEHLSTEFPARIGGEIFSDALSADECFAPLNKQASLAGAGATSPFSYSSPSGGASVTWTWTAFSLPLPDGSAISVPASTSGTQITVSGLTASTTYYFGIYYTVATGVVHIVLSDMSSGTAKQSLAQQVQTVNADGNIGIGVNVPATTGSSGGGSTGGGGGGSTCPSIAQLVETRERGFIPAGTIEVGMHLRGWHDDEWNEVLSVEIKPSTILAVKIAGEQFRVDANHKWLLFCEHEPTCEDCWIGSWELTLNTPLRGTDGNAHYAESISRIGKGEYAELNVETHRFRLGKVIGHNLITNLQ